MRLPQPTRPLLRTRTPSSSHRHRRPASPSPAAKTHVPSAPPAAARSAKPLRRPSFASVPGRFPHLSMSTSSSPRAPRLAASVMPSLLTADPDHHDAVLLAVRAAMGNCLRETRLDLAVLGLRLAAKGKVRDVYESGEHLVLVTTDRQSAFDRVLASIPFKGQYGSVF